MNRNPKPLLHPRPFLSSLSQPSMALIPAGVKLLPTWLKHTVFVIALILALNSLGVAQGVGSTDRIKAEALTMQLLSLQQRIRSAASASRSQLREQLESVAAARHSVLARLIDTNPKTVQRLAIPANLRAALPASVQASLEQEVQLEGKLEVVYEDYPKQAKLRHFLRVGGRRLELRFAQHPPTHLLTGAIVRVHGVQVEDKVAVASGTSSTSLATIAAAPLPNTFGDQKTLVILVNFKNNTSQPYTLTFAHDMTFNTTSNFDLENSYGQTWLTGNVVGWYTIPTASTCDYALIGYLANQAAAAAGINVSTYSHLVYGFPATSCGWLGVSYIGGNQSWINGNYELAVVAHEMGHQFGLYHSHSLNCAPNVDTGTCTTVEYGDTLDMMGNPRNFPGGDFDAFQKERLGWLNYGSSPAVLTVQSNGNYTIGPYEAQDGTTKALKIFKSKDPTTGTNTWYYVEYRQAIGFDNFLSAYSNITRGVVLHLGTDYNPNSSDLLDMTPAASSWMEVALDAGMSFTDPTTGTSIKTVSANSSSATVSVTLGSSSSTCTRGTPSLSMSPSQSAYVPAGTTVAYTVSLKNNDSSACNSSMFNLSPSAPTGWSDVLNNSGLTVAPGASAATTLQVTSPAGSGSGFYTVKTSASNSVAPTYQAAASATYALSSATCAHANPSISLSPAKSAAVSPGTKVAYNVSVKNNDSSGCSASGFSLNASGPRGWSTALNNAMLNLAPGTSSAATLQVTSPLGAGKGSYAVAVSATSSSAPTSQAKGSATYVVGSSSALSVTVATSRATYALGQQLWMTVRVSSGPLTVAGTNVTINIVDPHGAVATFKGTTQKWGGWQLGYKLPLTAPLGKYQVHVTATYRGISGQASTVFTVN